MIKKILKIMLLIIIVPILGVGVFIGYRIGQNEPGLVPYPYQIKTITNQEELAPIVIIGDRIGKRLATFKKELSNKITENMVKKIKILDLTGDKEGLHRSLHKLKSLNQVPLVTIYLGNYDQAVEDKFLLNQINTIKLNFDIYKNEYFKSLMMVFPLTSQILYSPLKKLKLGPVVSDRLEIEDDFYFQKIMEIEYLLYETQVDELLSYIKKRNGFIIPITTPIKLTSPPKKSCYGSLDKTSQDQINNLKKLIKNKNFKDAYTVSKELALIHSMNANILHTHAIISKKINKYDEAISFFEKAAIYDCKNINGNPIFNKILKKVAKNHKIKTLDFAKLIDDASKSNVTFLDDVYVQDIYFEKLVNILALQIKQLLKL